MLKIKIEENDRIVGSVDVTDRDEDGNAYVILTVNAVKDDVSLQPERRSTVRCNSDDTWLIARRALDKIVRERFDR